jgi:hypothetical protein
MRVTTAVFDLRSNRGQRHFFLWSYVQLKGGPRLSNGGTLRKLQPSPEQFAFLTVQVLVVEIGERPLIVYMQEHVRPQCSRLFQCRLLAD